jgi:hypothetical protein
MSMNLTLSVGEDGPNVDLWQTPTWVTWMCLSYDPDTKLPDGGMNGVRRRYIQWVESHRNGVWSDNEDYEYMCERVKDHIQLINSVQDPYFSFI